jgi:hypothetical protein
MASSHPSWVTRICEQCSTPFRFHAKPSVVAKGYGRFCSSICANRAQLVPLRERFWRYVGPVEENGCILWTGAKDADGYGVIRRGTQKANNVRAHRVSYEMFVGPVPNGLMILHTCDRPPCINPFHLLVGTAAENSDDMVAKDRQAKGERNGYAKLTATVVVEIRRRHEAGNLTHDQLAADYGVSSHAIWGVLNGKTWTHV